jgi:hypothetical protein
MQFSKLIVTIKSISGDFPWGGKALGFSFSNIRLANYQVANSQTFLVPEGRSVVDNFIEWQLGSGENLIFDISGLNETFYLGAKVYVGDGIQITLSFELME